MQQQLVRQPGQRYRYLAFVAAILLITGASIPSGPGGPSGDDKEIIIRLQGEVLVLQRQIRDLQESFDKWQAKSETSLNNLGSASETSARTLSSIDDKLQRNQGSQANAVAGVNAHLTKISEQIATNNRQVSQLGQNIDALKQSLQAMQESQRKLQEQESRNVRQNADDAMFSTAESLAAQGRFAEALAEYDGLLTKYPNGDRAPGALLKKGLTLLQMERRQEGVEALKSVVSLYPNTQESEMAKAELVRLGEARK